MVVTCEALPHRRRAIQSRMELLQVRIILKLDLLEPIRATDRGWSDSPEPERLLNGLRSLGRTRRTRDSSRQESSSGQHYSPIFVPESCRNSKIFTEFSGWLESRLKTVLLTAQLVSVSCDPCPRFHDDESRFTRWAASRCRCRCRCAHS